MAAGAGRMDTVIAGLGIYCICNKYSVSHMAFVASVLAMAPSEHHPCDTANQIDRN